MSKISELFEDFVHPGRKQERIAERNRLAKLAEKQELAMRKAAEEAEKKRQQELDNKQKD